MIPREQALRIVVIAALVGVASSQNARSYDTSDWIPLTDKCPTCQQASEEERVIEKKATGRVLNLAEPDPNHSGFFPEEDAVRSKKSSQDNVQQYLREIPLQPKSPLAQPEPVQQPRAELDNVKRQLNQGEFMNQQYFRQQAFKNAPAATEFQKPVPSTVQLNSQNILQQNPQLIPPQLIVPQEQQYFVGQRFVPQSLLNVAFVPPPSNLNVYQPNYQNTPANVQQLPQQNHNSGFKKARPFEQLNPGIQAINHGLSGDIVSSNNNYKDYGDISITSTSPKTNSEKESVQLLYVPLESLNQRQPQLQRQQVTFPREQHRLQEDQQLTAQINKHIQIQREQQLKSQQEQQLKAQQDQVFQQQQREASEQEQAQNLQQSALLEQSLRQVQQLQDSQRRRRPTRPQANPIYQSQAIAQQNESPFQHKQQQLQSIQNDFAQQALDALKLQLQLQLQTPPPTTLPQLSTTTLPSSTSQFTTKKRKPHQPPLAVYMGADREVFVTDVLNLLKSAKTISVQDSVGPNSPQVFIGPHNLQAPEGYAKFDLPYLNAIENNRVERKVDQLPFFVAPLSYKAPPGYSKIPLPAPHVGSVVVSQKDESPEKHTRQQPQVRIENLLNEQPYRLPNTQNYQIDQQARPIKPFKLENAINEDPYRLPNQHQNVYDPFAGALVNPATPAVPITHRPNLLGQTINQYELEQINSFLPQSQEANPNEYQSSQLNDDGSNEYEEIANIRQPPSRKNNRIVNTTPPLIPANVQFVVDNTQTSTKSPESKSRHSARPTQRPLSASTRSSSDKNKYTVLEEFSVRRKPTTPRVNYFESVDAPTTPPSNSQVHTANLHRERQPLRHTVQQQVQPADVSHFSSRPDVEITSQPFQQLTNQPTSQQILHTVYESNLQQQLSNEQNQNQELPQQVQLSNLPRNPPSAPTYFQVDNRGEVLPLRAIDDNTYKLVNQQVFQQEAQLFRGPETISTTKSTIPKEVVSSTARVTEISQEQTIRSNNRNSARTRSRGRTHYEPEVYQKTSEVKEENGDNYKLPELPAINPGLHSLINNLQDQAVRPLLIPASLAPTTEQTLISQPQQRQHSFQRQQHPLSIQQQQPIQEQILEQHQYQQPQQQLFLQHQQQFLPEVEQPQQAALQQPYLLVSTTEAELITTTPSLPPVTQPSTTTTVATTTTNRRHRGRQRTRISTTTSSPRRTSQRTRRPVSRSRNEQNRYHQQLIEDYNDYSPTKSVETHTKRHEIDYNSEPTRKPTSRQRLRNRGRPVHETSTTERTVNSNTLEENTFKQPALQSGFQASSDPRILQPQSYMQFEQPTENVPEQTPKITYVDQDQILKQYNQVYNSQQQQYISTEALPSGPADQQKLSVDVIINHPITETSSKEPVIISQPEDDTSYVRYNSNSETSTKEYYKEVVEETTKSPSHTRIRGRGRGRPKIKTTTTQRPVTTTVSQIKTTTEEPEEEEFYGFIRAPNFNRPTIIQQPKLSTEEPKLYSATYISSTRPPLINHNVITYEDQPVENSENVQVYSRNDVSSTPSLQFVGKIRPKYPLRAINTEGSAETVTEPITTERQYTIRTTKQGHNTKPRIRGRLRVPTRKIQNDQSSNQKQQPASSEIETHRYKTRGTSHFKVPEKLKKKSEDEEIKGGNYPVSFLKAQESSETERPRFQITIDPGIEETFDDGDQVPYSSIYSPKIIRKTTDTKNNDPESEFSNVNAFSVENNVPTDRKVVESQKQIEALPLIATTEPDRYNHEEEVEKTILDDILGDVKDPVEDESDLTKSSIEQSILKQDADNSEDLSTTTTFKPKTRRRGVWKLVKRPLDTFETAESQYIGGITANSFSSKESKDKSTNHFYDKRVFESSNHDGIGEDTNNPIIDKKTESHGVNSSKEELQSSPAESEDFIDSIYKMFGIQSSDLQNNAFLNNKSDIEQQSHVTTEGAQYIVLDGETTTQNSLKPSEYDLLLSEPIDLLPNKDTSSRKDDLESIAEQFVASENPLQSPQMPLEPADNSKEVKTSTSTEVSHETEICYRGRCVKSKGTDVPSL